MTSPFTDLAADRGGVFTTAQALTWGYDAWGLLRATKAGECRHLTRGLYAACEPGAKPLTDAARHGLLSSGALMLYGDARLAGHSALFRHGVPVWGADLSRVHLERPVKHEVQIQAFVIRPMTPPASTDGTVGVAMATVQHALEHGAEAGVVSADYALHERRVSEDDLHEAAERVKGWPRSARVRTMVAHVDARSESVGESRLRFAVAMFGITLVPQVPVVDPSNGRFVARVDFVVEGTDVVVEFDGKVKYSDGGTEALMAEKRREDELRRLGYTVVRVTWRDLYDLPAVVRWIRRAVAASPHEIAPHPRREVG
jgi:very-short-patch-repair endonuclease